MGNVAYAASVSAASEPANDRFARARPISLRPRRVKLPIHHRAAIVLGGAILGWAVPIACAATFW